MDKTDVIPIKLIGKNYVVWPFHLKHFVQGQGLSEYLDGTTTEPKYGKDKTTWIENNSIVTWILNSVDPSITLNHCNNFPRPLRCGII